MSIACVSGYFDLRSTLYEKKMSGQKIFCENIFHKSRFIHLIRKKNILRKIFFIFYFYKNPSYTKPKTKQKNTKYFT